MGRRRHLLWAAPAVALLLIVLALGAGHGAGTAQAGVKVPRALIRAPAGSHWLASWAAAPQAASADSPLARAGLDDRTIREIVMLSSAGAAVRVHLSNLYGRRPLIIGAATVAAAGRDGRLAAAPLALGFDGAATVRIPVGGAVVSDPVALRVGTLERLAITLYLPEATGPLTYHGTAEETSFLGSGDAVDDLADGWVGARSGDWYVISGVDTLSPPRYLGAVVALGDSITAGVHSTPNSFGAWPDDLARRLAAVRGDTVSVIDEGISGNRVLNPSPCCGPSALTRFRADVLAQSGVRDVILLEGINDIGFSQGRSALSAPHTDVSAAEIIAGDERMIAAAHAAGLRIFGATLLPFRGAFYWTPAGEAKREAVNDWIRHGGAFDGVFDFAAVMAQPGHPEVMDPALDSGDHLHPDNAGYARMARAVDLGLLTSGG